jgi:integrase
MSSITPLDICGRRRSPATMAGFHQDRAPHNKGLRHPADPPTVEEIVAVMRAAGDDADAVRLRGVIVVLWRAGLRISEALALTESDLDSSRGAILVRHGKGGKRREVGMDRWGWGQLDPWLRLRCTLPVGALFCVLRARRAGARGHQPAFAPSCTTLLARLGCAAGSRRINCATHMRLRCHARVCRCWSSSASSATPISRSRRCTCAGSITPRSCTPSMSGQHR